MAEKYTVYAVFNGEKQVLGHFEVKDNQIYYANKADEHNCDIFPAGPIHPATKHRLESLLDNPNKSVYIVRG